MQITDLLAFGVKNRASDLHLSSGISPMIRIHGDIHRVNLPETSPEEVGTMITSVTNDHQRKPYQQDFEVDLSLELPNIARFRTSTFMTERGPAAVFRTIPGTALTLEELRMPRVFQKIAENPRGLALATGPTSSGKSTTLAAMVNYISETQLAHILTIEDPIESVHQSKKVLINQRELHQHTHSLTNALCSALREDPDVILIGEMRDPETTSLALAAVEAGHLVLGTLHTTGATKTTDRIADVFPAGEEEIVRSILSESLHAIASQTLLKTRDGNGRVAAHEILIPTSAVRNLIRENKIAQINAALQTSQAHGMQTLDQAPQALVHQGIISPEMARSKAQDIEDLSVF